MNKLLSDVLEFHKTYNTPAPTTPGFPEQRRIDLRIQLMEEELREVKEAIQKKDLVNLAKELADLLYVVNGTVIEFGLADKMDRVHDAVHGSNMSKLDEFGQPIFKPNGKVAKGPFYYEPNIEGIINEQI